MEKEQIKRRGEHADGKVRPHVHIPSERHADQHLQSKGKSKADSDAESQDSMLMEIDMGAGAAASDFDDEEEEPAPKKTTTRGKKAAAPAKKAPAKKAPAKRGKKAVVGISARVLSYRC